MPTEPFSLRSIAVPAYGPSLLYGIASGAILPVIALTARNLGASVALAALTITLLGIGSLLMNIPATVITTRFGERRALVAASLWCSLGMLLGVFAPNLPVFAAAIFMVGMAGSVFLLARQSYLTEAVPAYMRARALSTLGGVNRIGVFIGPFAAAGVIGLMGISGAYWVGMAAMLVAAALGARMPDLEAGPIGPGPGSAHGSRGSSGAQSPTTAPGARPTVASILRSHRHVFLTVGAGVLLIAAVRATRQAVIPLWAESLGLDPATTAVIYGISGGVDMLMFYPAGKLMDTRGRLWVAVPSMAIMGAGLLLLPFTADAAALLGAALVIGFGNGIGSGIVMTLGADFSPSPGRPQFLGIWRFLTDLGTMSGPGILSWITAVVSLAAGIWVTAGLGLLAAVVLWLAVPRAAAVRDRIHRAG